MAENSQVSQPLEVVPQAEGSPIEGDKQSMLLKLAERTVLQAEALAQEIIDHARQESEAEVAKILAQYTEQAKAEAQQTTESAQRRSETLLDEAAAEALSESEKTVKKAQSESEKMLSKAQSDSEKMLSKAQSESEKMLSKAQSESEEGLGKAQTESQEILGRARQDALAIINASQARADSTESKARLRAEFIIRQTTQNVADGIRSAVLETCNNLLLTVEDFGKETSEGHIADQVDRTAADETEKLENSNSQETDENSTPADLARPGSESSDRPSDRRAKSPARKNMAA